MATLYRLYYLSFTTPRGYKHTECHRDWRQAWEAYALALKTYGAADLSEVTHQVP